MAEPDKLQVGGITFDGAALDALIDDEPLREKRGPNDQHADVGGVDSDFAEQVQGDQVDIRGDEDGRGILQDEVAEQPVPDDETEAETEQADSDTDTESDVPLEGEEFITDGEEGPLLLTGIGEDGKPIYEAAEELFGDHQFRIKAAGQEHTVTFNEMRQGYQRQADYTKAKTEVVQMQRNLQPFMGLVNYWNESEDFRNVISEYIEGTRSPTVSDDELMEAFDSEDKTKFNALMERKRNQEKRKQAYDVATRATQEQQKAFALEQHNIAATIIDDYTNTMPNVKNFLTSLGYGDNEVQGLEYADARLQNLAYLAYRQANPNSVQGIHGKPDQALRSKRKMIVKRPPRPVSAGAGTSNTPNASNVRRQREAFKKAYKTGKESDLTNALALALPEDLLVD